MRELSNLFEPVYLRREIAEMEKLAEFPLMERAGLAVAEFVRDGIEAGKVLVLAGPGNNGGDAFVAARQLQSWWIDVTLVFAGDAGRLPPDAALARRAWLDSGGSCHSTIPEGKWDLIVDGLFGTGLDRPLAEDCRALVDAVNALDIPVVSIDMPSGIDADTGAVLGAAVKAAHTLTFIAFKPGLLTADGLDYCGEVRLDRLGLSPISMHKPQGWMANSEILGACFEKRALNSHKGSYGSTAVIGGAKGMRGAGLLAARAALKLGSGKVFLGTEGLEVDFLQPEIMVGDAAELMAVPTIVIGPGLGRSEAARHLVELAIRSKSALVIDADALNLVAEEAGLQEMLSGRSGFFVLTPHPAEAARLLGCTASDIQKDRILSARRMARQFGCPVVLKGAGSVSAFPSGEWVINTSGNPGLAQAGTGDVLAGIIGAFLSQGLSPGDALLCAVHLHGAAADKLSREGDGPIGATASELVDAARRLLNERVY